MAALRRAADGCLMLGNLFKESGVAERLNKTAQNELMNIVTIFLGVTVGATATAPPSSVRRRLRSWRWAWLRSASAPQAAFCSPSS